MSHLAQYRQSGGTSRTVVLLVAGVGIGLGGIVWLSLRHAIAQVGEQELNLTVVCAACGHVFGVSHDGLAELANQACAKGVKGIGSGPGTPLGVCPKCGKAAVYRASQCSKCGKPVAPRDAAADGIPPPGRCKACGGLAES